MSEPRNTTTMSLRLPMFVREEISKTADVMNVTDSTFVRIAVASALAKYAQRTAPNSLMYDV